MGLDFNFGSLDVKWQRLQVGYLSEKSMLTIDFLPKYHWFPGQKCLKTMILIKKWDSARKLCTTFFYLVQKKKLDQSTWFSGSSLFTWFPKELSKRIFLFFSIFDFLGQLSRFSTNILLYFDKFCEISSKIVYFRVFSSKIM